jgi:prophage regulatory protein
MSVEARSNRILRLPGVKEKTGKGKTAIYDAVKAGTFPAPIKLGRRASGWLESEIDDWIARCQRGTGAPAARV